MDVEDVISKRTTEEQRQVEVAVAEVLAGRQGKLRQTIAHLHTVVCRCLGSTDDVTALVIDQPLAILCMTSISPHIKVTDRLAFLNALQVVVRIWIRSTYLIIIVLTYKLGVAEAYELILHGRTDEVEVVREILGSNWTEIEVKLKTVVLHRTYIDECIVEEVWRNRYLVVTQQVLLFAVEVVQRTIDAIVEQREVDTYVPVLTLLPHQVRVHILGWTPNLEELTIIYIVAKSIHGIQ